MTLTAELLPGQLTELVEQLKAGNEVIITQGSEPVAKLVPASETVPLPIDGLRIYGFKGYKVLTPVITHADIAEDMYDDR